MSHHINIRRKIIISSVSILLLSLILSGSFFFVSYFNIRKSDTLDELDASLSHVAATLSSNFSSVNNLASSFCSTHYIRQWTYNTFVFDKNIPKTYNIISSIENDLRYQLIFNDAWLNKHINTIYLVADNEYMLLSSRVDQNATTLKNEHEEIFEQTKRLERGTYLLPSASQDNASYFIKKLSNSSFNKDLSLIISLDASFFTSAIAHLSPDTIVSVSKMDEEFFFSSPKNLSTDTLQKEYLTIERKLPDSDFYIALSIPKHHITGKLLDSLLSYLILMVGFIFLVGVIAVIVVGNYTRIIQDLLHHIDQLRLKNYSTRMPTYKDQDLNQISANFNTMAAEFDFLIDRVYKNEILLKESELKMLQSQMNPHFLLNTLTTISTKALMCQDPQLYEMVHALTALLSASLYNKQDSLCKISDELEYVKMYLSIQHIRFGDKIKYHLSTETPDLLECYIPRLSIEPLVENAAIHGLNTQLEGGSIWVHIQSLTDKTLLITIKDNGKGFDVDAILNNPPTLGTKGHHIGIFNTDKRLKLLYGDEYGVSFESSPQEGTTAFIKIPKHYQTYYERED